MDRSTALFLCVAVAALGLAQVHFCPLLEMEPLTAYPAALNIRADCAPDISCCRLAHAHQPFATLTSQTLW
jgi:hypothetical protein